MNIHEFIKRRPYLIWYVKDLDKLNEESIVEHVLNYGDWDDDMMVGSVHILAYLELVYWLKRINYKGWLTLDIFPYRENGVAAATQCKEWMEAMFRSVDRAGMDSFAQVIRNADACEASALIRKALNL